MEKKLANIERQKKEENLRQLAQKARNTRIGLKETAPNEGSIQYMYIAMFRGWGAQGFATPDVNFSFPKISEVYTENSTKVLEHA